MGILSLIIFACSLLLSFNGFLLIFGLESDIEGGAYFIALLLGLPLFCIGAILGVVGIFLSKKHSLKSEDKKAWLSLYSTYGVVMNSVAIVFWIVHLLASNFGN